jgi:ribosomal protein L39E
MAMFVSFLRRSKSRRHWRRESATGGRGFMR